MKMVYALCEESNAIPPREWAAFTLLRAFLLAVISVLD
jgi:hypothetical protein